MTSAEKAVARRVAEIRTARGWSRAELARRAHAHPHAIDHLETNRTSPQFYTMLRVAKALGVSLCALTGETPLSVVRIETRVEVMRPAPERPRLRNEFRVGWSGLRKGKPSSDKARRAVALMLAGMSYLDAAEEVGVSSSSANVWFMRWVELPRLRARVKELESREGAHAHTRA